MRPQWLLWLSIGLVLAGTNGSTQSGPSDQSGAHLNALEPSSKAELTIPTDVIISNCMLAAGTYIVTCDREVVTFALKATGERMVVVPCKGPVMKRKAEETRAVYEPQPSGYVVFDKLYFKGNTVEHIF